MGKQPTAGPTRGNCASSADRRFAKSEASHQDSLTQRQEMLLALDRKRQRREEAMALAAIQKARPLRPPRATS